MRVGEDVNGAWIAVVSLLVSAAAVLIAFLNARRKRARPSVTTAVVDIAGELGGKLMLFIQASSPPGADMLSVRGIALSTSPGLYRPFDEGQVWRIPEWSSRTYTVLTDKRVPYTMAGGASWECVLPCENRQGSVDWDGPEPEFDLADLAASGLLEVCLVYTNGKMSKKKKVAYLLFDKNASPPFTLSQAIAVRWISSKSCRIASSL